MSESEITRAIASFTQEFNTTDERYFSISSDVIDRLTVIANKGQVYTSTSSPSFRQFQDTNWGQLEPWGSWSIGKKSSLKFRIANGTDPVAVYLKLTSFFALSHQAVDVSFLVNGKQIAATTISSAKIPIEINLELPAALLAKSNGLVAIDIHVANPASPAELNLSPDNRRLGVGLIAISIK
ncbi:hypothetical protein [Lysobacter soyae]|uniref:Uncharacterized protein n=1 Tax=Lysobacter soyae TaxID=2764185 RepID=A0ABX8WQA7_9GAMM|nr:hypothetical protein [Lysobacter sp. CJ11]QYR52734.1 hypothetical protein H8L67_09140 [Lysobacter sp. CJ11]